MRYLSVCSGIEAATTAWHPLGWTDVPYRGKPAADGPRYKALGNSMAVPVMRWIGERIASVDAIEKKREAA
jgi:DNA (cytosine-5)-methyltransferase 1